jgi:hypothetical protein
MKTVSKQEKALAGDTELFQRLRKQGERHREIKRIANVSQRCNPIDSVAWSIAEAMYAESERRRPKE